MDFLHADLFPRVKLSYVILNCWIRVENSAEDFKAFTVIFYQRNKPNYKKWFKLQCIMFFLFFSKIFMWLLGYCVHRNNSFNRYKMKQNGRVLVKTWWAKFGRFWRTTLWANYFVRLSLAVENLTFFVTKTLPTLDVFEDHEHVSPWWTTTLGLI